jgi:hypothetical protein
LPPRADPRAGEETNWPRWWLLLPLVAAFLSAWPATGNGFTNDDDILIVNNPLVHSFDHLHENLTSDFFHTASTSAIGYYRPAVKLLFMIEYQAFSDSPVGYHVVSVLLFLSAVVMAFLLIRRLGFGGQVATCASVLFATTPVQAESVAIVASQSDLLSVALMLACCWCYVGWRRSGRPFWFVLAMLCQILALASKEIGVLIPLLLAYYELVEARGGRSALRQRLGALWFLLPVAAYGALRVALGVLPLSASSDLPAIVQSLTSAKVLVSIFLRAALPVLWAPYLHAAAPAPVAGQLLTWCPSAVALLAGAGVLIWRRRRWGWAALLLLVPMLPVLPSSIVHVSGDPRLLVVSDRWVLLPALGAGLLWALLLRLTTDAAGKRFRLLMPLGIAVLALLQGLDARLENASFRDEETRMQMVGDALRQQGNLTPAEQEQVLAASAIAAERRRDIAQSAKIYAQLVRLDPGDHNRQFNLAVALLQSGRPRQALRHAKIAYHSVDPQSGARLPRKDSFFRNRPHRAFLVGLLLERLKRPQQAQRYFRWCLQHNPRLTQCREHLRGPGPRPGSSASPP